MPVLVGSLAGSLLAGAGVGLTTALTIGTSAGSVLVPVGVSLAASALARTLTDKSGPSPAAAAGGIAAINAPEVRGSVKQATAPLRVVFGEARVGGVVYFYDKNPPFLYLGLMHSILPISEYRDLYIGDTLVLLNNVNTPLAAPYVNRLVVNAQAGLDTDAQNTRIANDWSLPADFRLPGVANSVFRFHYGSDFAEFEALWGQVQVPRAEWVVRGTPVPDPRRAAHRLDPDPRDPADLYDAIASWDWSNNASLIQAFWTAMPFGLNASFGAIRWDEVARAADFDDERVALKGGGSQARHTIDGVVSLDQKPLTVMEAMLTANRGFISPSRGGVTVSSSQPRDPVMTITDSDIIGGFTFRDDQPKRDLANVASCTFIAPDRAWQDATGPVLRDEALIAADGEELEMSVRMPFTSTHQRAQRVLKGFRDETRVGRLITCVVSLRALGLVEGMVARFESAIWPAANGIYQVHEWGLAESFAGIALVLAEYDAQIARAWNAAADEQAFALEVEEAA
jgi:hypothetical protein